MQDEKKFTISQFVIICAACILAVATVCGVFILVAYFKANPIGSAENEKTIKHESISIQVDGLSFTLKEKFGDTLRQIAKQRTPYESYADSTAISNIDSFLKKPYENTSTEVHFKNRSNTYYNVTVTSPNDGVKHESNFTLADSAVILEFNVRNSEVAKIDNLEIQANKTTKDDLRSMFEDIEIQENPTVNDFATHIAKYKGWEISFSYQNGIIVISFKGM